MADIEIYTSMWCPYCSAAKRLLEKKGCPYREIDVHETPGARDEMADRAGGSRTVPQIFVDGRHLGDCDAIMAMEAEGTLDARLGLATGAPKAEG